MTPLKNRSDLFDNLLRGVTVVTPNNRLSNQLLRDFTKRHPDIAQEKPRCRPYTAFLRRWFQELQHEHSEHDHPILLAAHQERALWKHVLSEHHAGTYSEGLLQTVQEAWTRCQHWQLDMHSAPFQQTPQTQQFQRWQEAFSMALEAQHAITESQLVPYLLGFPLGANASSLIWLSFDDYTPQQRRLQAELESQGYPQWHEDLTDLAASTTLYGADDPQEELTQLVQWLKQQRSVNKQRIGVIVPDLQQTSLAIQRRLLRDFPAEEFDISLGKALTDAPIITHALHWLNLDQTTLTHHQVNLLLHSPYLGGSRTESTARAALFEINPLFQEATISYPLLMESFARATPKLAGLLETLTPYPKTSAPYEWIQCFKQRLSQLGFPGEYTLSSEAYQYVQRLNALFDDFLQLALIHPTMTQTEALQHLRELANTSIFQVRKAPSPIQVLGLLEASGCAFDCIWVMGLTDQCLPQRVHLSPYIPVAIQREQEMPHAIPERELAFANQLLHRLRCGSQETVFSYPRLTQDSPNLPSPLVADYPPYQPVPVTLPAPQPLLENYQDDYTYPMLESEPITGGTTLLANQAKCPFKAFAAHRLHAKAGLQTSTGLNDAERGQLIHRVMEQIWKQLQNQEALLKLTERELKSLVEEAVFDAIAPALKHRSASCPELIQSIEHERIKRLVLACLEWEKQRTPFTVKAIEEAYTLTLAGLDFNVRVDRLDRVTEEETWVIDYKSSLPSNKPWNEERPEAPQLLLYALLDPSIHTLLFLQLKAGQVVCSGISQDDSALSGISTLKKGETWSEKRHQWHERLTRLATEFKEGLCLPKPQRTSTCQTCEFINLCRTELHP